jgi:hypothetical protein
MTPCTVCASPSVDAVDRLLLQGATARRVAALFDLSKSSCQRHRSYCLRGARLATAKRAARDALLSARGLDKRLLVEQRLNEQTRATLDRVLRSLDITDLALICTVS